MTALTVATIMRWFHTPYPATVQALRLPGERRWTYSDAQPRGPNGKWIAGVGHIDEAREAYHLSAFLKAHKAKLADIRSDISAGKISRGLGRKAIAALNTNVSWGQHQGIDELTAHLATLRAAAQDGAAALKSDDIAQLRTAFAAEQQIIALSKNADEVEAAQAEAAILKAHIAAYNAAQRTAGAKAPPVTLTQPKTPNKTLYGPLQPTDYAYYARRKIEGQFGAYAPQASKDARAAMWRNYANLKAAVKASKGDVLTTVYDFMKGLNSFAKDQLENRPPGGLGEHLHEITEFSRAFVLENGYSRFPALLTTHEARLFADVIAPLHDALKFLGSMDAQIAPDHEAMTQALVLATFPGKQVVLNGRAYTLTKNDVEFIAHVIGDHENIEKEAGRRDYSISPNAETRAKALFFVADTLTGALKPTGSGKFAFDPGLLQSRFTDLYFRHIDLVKGKIFRPEWGSETIKDLVTTFQTLETNGMRIAPLNGENAQTVLVNAALKSIQMAREADAARTSPKFTPSQLAAITKAETSLRALLPPPTKATTGGKRSSGSGKARSSSTKTPKAPKAPKTSTATKTPSRTTSLVAQATGMRSLAEELARIPAAMTHLHSTAAFQRATTDRTFAEIPRWGTGYDPHGDRFLSAYMHEVGRDDLPRMVNEAEMMRLIMAGGPELWRAEETDAYRVQLLTGAWRVGLGYNGNGLYVGIGNEGKSFARGFGGQVIRMTLDPSAKIAPSSFYKDLPQLREAMLKEAEKTYTKDELATLAQLLGDPGRVATILGYDAIDPSYGTDYRMPTPFKTNDERIILNRGLLIAQETPPPGYYWRIMMADQSRAQSPAATQSRDLAQRAAAIRTAPMPEGLTVEGYTAELARRDAAVAALYPRRAGRDAIRAALKPKS